MVSESSVPLPWDLSPVLPVVQVADVSAAVPLARALAAGGIPVIEVTLRTPAALEAIAVIAAECPDVCVGAGTIRSGADVDRALAAGARFLVTPGTPATLADALVAGGVPVLPGIATPTEAMAMADRGFGVVKLFPASVVGGPAWIRALAGPLSDLGVVPAGGVSLASAPDYLALASVPTVGASWLTPADLVAAGDWDRITALARDTMRVLQA